MPQPTPTKFSLQVNQVLDFVTLKVIFTVHFILLSIALTLLNWLPAIFLYYNSLLFLLLLWGNHLLNRSANDRSNQSTTTSADVVLLAAVVSGTSIALDIICICTMYSLVSELSRFAASFVFIVLNLVLRPLTTFILTRLYYAKSTSKSGHVLPMTTNSGSGQPPSQLNSAIRKILLLDATSLAHSGPPASVRESYREVHQQYQQQQQQQQPAHLQMSQQFSQQQQQQQQPHKRVSSLQLNRPVITLNTHHSGTLQQSSAQSVAMSAATAPVVLPGHKQAADTISLASALSVSELSSMEPISITTPLPAPRQSSQSPTNSTTSASNHRQSTYIDPETGETFQERMI